MAPGLIIAAILGVIYRKSLAQNWPIIVAPIGCIVALVVALITFSSLNQKTDKELYQEVFGYAPSMGEDRMLANDQNGEYDRAIFLRAEVIANEKVRLLQIPGLVPSNLTMEYIIGVGTSRGFSWWIEKDPFVDFEGCESSKISEAPGYNNWDDFVVIECPQQPNHTFMRSGHTDFVYVIATRKE